jgi:hypothetical protein
MLSVGYWAGGGRPAYVGGSSTARSVSLPRCSSFARGADSQRSHAAAANSTAAWDQPGDRRYQPSSPFQSPLDRINILHDLLPLLSGGKRKYSQGLADVTCRSHAGTARPLGDVLASAVRRIERPDWWWIGISLLATIRAPYNHATMVGRTLGLSIICLSLSVPVAAQSRFPADAVIQDAARSFLPRDARVGIVIGLLDEDGSRRSRNCSGLASSRRSR